MQKVAVTYDVDQEVNWGYSYLAMMDDEGRCWFNQMAVEQYEIDWSEVDSIDFGVHLERRGNTLDSACYWHAGNEVPVVMHKPWDIKHIDGVPHWAIPEAWRPVTDADFAETVNA